MTKPQDLIQPRITSYLKSSWFARWIIIAIVAASFLFVPDVHRQVVGILLVAGAIYNLVVLLGSRRGWTIINNQPLMIIIDGLLALVLTMYTGNITSPYLLLLIFMIISGAYWYGTIVAIAIGAGQTLFLVAYELVAAQPFVFPKTLVVRMLILTTIGIYVSWLTASERSERNKLITLGTEAEKERQQLLALINNMRDAVVVIDNDDNVVIHNQAAIALAGAGKDMHNQPINRSIQFLNANNRLIELNIKHVKDALEQKDLRIMAPDGSLINVTVSVAPYIVDRRSSGHVLIIHDVSQEKTIDKEREEFIAVASHELRTPLTIAQSAISFLLSPPYLPENQESVHMLNSALRSLKQLSHIISDLTNLSQVENEQLEVQLEPLNPIALLHDFQSDYDGQAKAKGLELKVKIDPGLNSATILTSRYVVGEILSIFVSNALKFTEKGSVTLSVMNPKDNNAGVSFSVSDSGIGISQSDQEKIFKKFFQSEDYSTRVHGGTGLGLYIAQRLARRITAKISFETELGKGSTFYLWVPPYSKHKQDRGKVAAAEAKDFFNTV